MSDSQPFPTNRGQSEVLGYILIIGIGFVAISLILVFGGQAVQLFESQAQDQSASNAFSELDSEVSTVALSRENSERVTVDLSLNSRSESNSLTVQGGGTFRIAAVNGSNIDASQYQTYLSSDNDRFNGGNIVGEGKSGDDENRENLYANITMGQLLYEGDEFDIAYQGGGVWKKAQGSEESSVVSPPEFHYRGQGKRATATLPLITVEATGRQLGDSNVDVSRVDNSASECDVTSAEDCVDKTIPSRLENRTLFVAVQSDYYRGWGEYFEQQTQAEVIYDDAENRAVIKMVGPEIRAEATFEEAVVSASGQSADISNNIEINSYNYSTLDGDSPEDASEGNASITYAGDITLGQNVEINGTVILDGTLTLNNNAKVDGNVTCADGSDACVTDESQVTGEIIGRQVSINVDPVDGIIDRRVANARDENNNDEASGIADDGTPSGGTITIDEGGTYYIASDDFDGLDVNTDGERVNIVLDDDLNEVTEKSGDSGPDINGSVENIEIGGDGDVRMYVDGDGDSSGGGDREATDIGFDGTVEIEDNNFNSSQFVVYGSKGTQAAFGGGKWTGVLYAPGNTDSKTTIALNKNLKYYGATVGAVNQVGQNVELYYDEELEEGGPRLVPTTETSVLYLHVSENRVTIR